MVDAAIFGLGWWGKVLVKAVQQKSDKIRFTHGHTRTRAKGEEFADAQGFALCDTLDELLADDAVDAIVLATPPSGHLGEIVACAEAGKHVFVEKPFTFTRAEAEAAIAAVEAAGVKLAIGFNRRFHPAMVELRQRLADEAIGTLLHVEGTMTAPAGLSLPPGAWRSQRAEAPGGRLAPMGIHIIDAVFDLFGEADSVYAQSFRRASPTPSDDTTSMLCHLKNGMSAYICTLMATQVSYRFQVFGSKGWLAISNPDLSRFEYVPTAMRAITGQAGAKVDPEVLEFPGADTVHAELEAFADDIDDIANYPVTHGQMVHGSAIFEAVIDSAAAQQVVKIA